MRRAYAHIESMGHNIGLFIEEPNHLDLILTSPELFSINMPPGVVGSLVRRLRNDRDSLLGCQRAMVLSLDARVDSTLASALGVQLCMLSWERIKSIRWEHVDGCSERNRV